MVMRGLTTIYLVGGLGFEDHPNSLREVPILPRKILESLLIKPRTRDELEQKIRDTLADF